MSDRKQRTIQQNKALHKFCELTGQSSQTLRNWDDNKPELFKAVLAGAVSIKRESRSAEHVEK